MGRSQASMATPEPHKRARWLSICGCVSVWGLTYASGLVDVRDIPASARNTEGSIGQ